MLVKKLMERLIRSGRDDIGRHVRVRN
jgi:hypothetical protein